MINTLLSGVCEIFIVFLDLYQLLNVDFNFKKTKQYFNVLIPHIYYIPYISKTYLYYVRVLRWSFDFHKVFVLKSKYYLGKKCISLSKFDTMSAFSLALYIHYKSSYP